MTMNQNPILLEQNDRVHIDMEELRENIFTRATGIHNFKTAKQLSDEKKVLKDLLDNPDYENFVGSGIKQLTASQIENLDKIRKKNLLIGSGKAAASAAALAGAGYGAYRLAKWLKNKKKKQQNK